MAGRRHGPYRMTCPVESTSSVTLPCVQEDGCGSGAGSGSGSIPKMRPAPGLLRWITTDEPSGYPPVMMRRTSLA